MDKFANRGPLEAQPRTRKKAGFAFTESPFKPKVDGKRLLGTGGKGGLPYYIPMPMCENAPVALNMREESSHCFPAIPGYYYGKLLLHGRMRLGSNPGTV